MARYPGTGLLLLGVVGWIVAAGTSAFAATALLAFIAGFFPPFMANAGIPGSDLFPVPSDLAYGLIAVGAFHGTLLLAAVWQCRRSDSANRFAGLGVITLWRTGLIVRLCLLLFAWAIGIIILTVAFPDFRALAQGAASHMLAPGHAPGPMVLISGLLLITVLAPLAEETFFRGWLWDALHRRGHGVWMTAGITSVLWLLLHAPEAPTRVLFLLPAAAAFSIARHRAGGVRASLAVHVVNNAMAVAMMALPKMLATG
jgi:membrane protease YdiL (CAAX protease family)